MKLQNIFPTSTSSALQMAELEDEILLWSMLHFWTVSSRSLIHEPTLPSVAVIFWGEKKTPLNITKSNTSTSHGPNTFGWIKSLDPHQCCCILKSVIFPGLLFYRRQGNREGKIKVCISVHQQKNLQPKIYCWNIRENWGKRLIRDGEEEKVLPTDITPNNYWWFN